MRSGILAAVVLACPALLLVTPASAIKKISYQEVKVDVPEPAKPDPQFETARKAFTDAVNKKDAEALFRLVGPSFIWTVQNALSDQYDLSRDGMHNFKVMFGFRDFGKDTDGGVEGGPNWELLNLFAAETNYYESPNAGSVVCTPATASLANADAFDNARRKIETDDEAAEWYFTIRETPVQKSPTDAGAPLAKVAGKIALPVLNTYPTAKEGEAPPPPTHLEVLLPSGRTGWVAAAAVRPLTADRLCFAKAPSGEWKIALYDQGQGGEEGGD